jgi:hypothetical protein
MRSRRTWVDILGPVFGILAAALTVYALVYLLWIEPFYRGDSCRSYDSAGRDFVTGPGWESREVTERFEGSFGELENRNVAGSPFGSVSFDIRVPPSIKEIRANNISGNIKIENMGAGVEQTLETVSGPESIPSAAAT